MPAGRKSVERSGPGPSSTIGQDLRTPRSLRQERRQEPVAEETTRAEPQAVLSGEEADADGHDRQVEGDVEVGREPEQVSEVQLLLRDVQHQEVDGAREGRRTEHEHRLREPRAGRLQDRCGRDAARVGQAVEVDHLLAQRDDEREADHRTDDATEDHQPAVEVGQALVFTRQDEEGRDGEHHPRRGRVDRGRDALVDVVLDDARPAQEAAQDAPAEDRRELRAFDREAQDQRRVADRGGDDRAEEPADDDAGPGELGIGAFADLGQEVTPTARLLPNEPRACRPSARSCATGAGSSGPSVVPTCASRCFGATTERSARD